MSQMPAKKVAIIVAHPDDETLWAGGTILSHPSWHCFVISLCRREDKDRAPKFIKALEILKSEGIMGDLDDGPEQIPQQDYNVENEIIKLLPPQHYDLIITHHPLGEYTRHLRHEEVGRATINLWNSGKISTDELWIFAYEDGNKKYLPRPVKEAPVFRDLTKRIWKRKYSIITEIYGFDKNSFEAETTPRSEAFYPLSNSYEARQWLDLQSSGHLI